MAWSQEQMTNAALIYSVGRQMGMSTRDIQTGIITAMVESNLVNVNYGDRDSLGLFQQRPSQGWGTPAQVTNPKYAATKFFSALKGLGDKRFQMGMGEAAQAVQRSAFPDRYAERIGAMRSIWPQIQKSAGETPQGLDGEPYMPTQEDLMKGVAPFPTKGAPGPATGTVGAEGAAVSAEPQMPPSTHAMLGAWGMSNPTLTTPDVEAQTFIGPSTNQSFIQPLSQEVGNFEQGVDGWRKAVLQYARQAIGKPYVWGGTNLSSGVDCSGLIQAAFAKAGIEIPRVSYQQANFGKRVGIDALRPGDLVAWDNSSRNAGADHIAFYLGNGQILESPRPGSVVRIRSLGKDEGGWGVKLNFGK